MSNSKSPRWALALTAVCALGLIAAIFAAMAITSQYHIQTRGMSSDFPQPIAYADAPRWGVNVALEQYDDAALRRNLDEISATGFSWVRQTFPWSKIEPERGQFDWAAWDRIVSAAAVDQTSEVGSRKPESLQLIAVLDTAPPWSQSQYIAPTSDIRRPPIDPADFARFAGEFARRYGDRIHFYQIWDEPNLGDRWDGAANPTAFAEMLRQAREAIRANDPHAVILLAGLAPTAENSSENTSDWLYLRKLYEAGAGQYFDIASGKPYGFSTGPDDRRVDPDLLNFSHIILMREEMIRHGDSGKPLWASHWGWNALPPDWTGSPSIWGSVSQDQQARFTLGAMERVEREWPWMGVMALENWQPAASLADPRWGFAIVGQDGQLRPVALAIRDDHSAGPPGNGVGYHPAAQPALPGSSSYVAGPAEFSPPDRWRFSALGADWAESGDKVAITFRGTGLALRVRRAADRANLYITIDGQPANALPRDDHGAFLQLIPPESDQISVDTIPIAAGLAQGAHTAEIIAKRGWNQWALVGWSVESESPAAGRFRSTLAGLAILGAMFAAGGLWAARRARWSVLSGIYRRLSDAAHLALLISTAAVFYVSTWLTWGQQILSVSRRLDGVTGILAMLGVSTLFYFSPWLVVTVVSGLALFVPFYMLPRELGERVFSMTEILVVLCLLAWLLHLIPQVKLYSKAGSRQSAVIPRLSSLDWATATFVVVAIASLFVADYLKYALREFRGIVLEPALFYLMLRTTLKRNGDPRDRQTLWRLVDALMVAGLIVAVIGLVQYTFNINIITAEEGQHRLRSVYGSPNNVGLFLGRVLPVLLAVAALGRGRRRLLYGLGALPVALAILLSLSKGALLLGIPAALLVMGVLAGGRWLWATVAALGAGGLAAIPLLRTPRFQSTFDLTSGTSFFRINVWRSALLMIRDRPILGVGLDNFLYQYRGRYMFPEAWGEPMLSHPHNVVLDYAVRMGLLGLAAGLWLQAAFWRAALPLRKLQDPLHRALAIGLMGSMADFLAHGLVDAAYFVPDLAYVFFITLAVVQVMPTIATPEKNAADKEALERQ